MPETGKWFPRIGSVYAEYLFASAAQCDTDTTITLYRNDIAIASLVLLAGSDVVAEVSCEGELITISDAIHFGLSGSTPDLLVVELWGRGNGGGGLIFSEEGGIADPAYSTLTLSNAGFASQGATTDTWIATYNGTFISVTIDAYIAEHTAGVDYHYVAIVPVINGVDDANVIYVSPRYDESVPTYDGPHVTISFEYALEVQLGDEVYFRIADDGEFSTWLDDPSGTITLLTQEVETNVELVWQNPS